MTKKSEGRRFRDKQRAAQMGKLREEGRKGWDEVNTISEGCLAQLMIPTTFKDHLKNRALLSHLTQAERDDLAMKVRLLEKDLMTMLEKVKVIRALHKGKTGMETDFGEVFETYEVVEKYVVWQSEYDAFILPTKGDIIQYLSDAEGRHRQHMIKLQAAAGAATTNADPASDIGARMEAEVAGDIAATTNNAIEETVTEVPVATEAVEPAGEQPTA